MLASIKFYNFSDKDFDDVPVYISLRNKSGETPEILKANVTGSNNFSGGVQPLDELSTDPSEALFGYTVKTMNRLGDEEVFSASFVIAGNVEPDVSTSIPASCINFYSSTRSPRST